MTGRSPRPKRRPARVIAAALCASIALTVLAGLVWMIVDPELEILAVVTGIAALLTLLFAAWLVAVMVIGARRFRPVMAVAMAGVLVGVLLLIGSLLLDRNLPWGIIKVVNRVGVTGLLPALAIIHNGGMSLLRTRSALMVIKIITMICAWVFVAGVLALNWMEPFLFSPWFARMMTIITFTVVAAVGTIAGTIIVPIVAISRADRTARPVESVDRRLSIDMACPKCGHRQAFAVGNARCPACRARLFIEVEEPRCECGYLLYRLEGDVCPECGRTIPQQMRWPSASVAAGEPAASG
jgi:hypothetical protein